MRRTHKKTYLISESFHYTGKEVNSMDDQRIIELYFARDEQAIRETENKYGKLCFQIAINVLNAREDAEECVNDTYNGLWNTIPPTRPANFRAFAAKIARNLSLKRLEYLTREKRSAENTVPLDELADILPDERYAPGIGDEEVGKHISAFLRMEKPDARRVFVRRYFYFDPVASIAERYSFTTSKVKNMLFNTRKRLKDYLIKEGIEI